MAALLYFILNISVSFCVWKQSPGHISGTLFTDNYARLYQAHSGLINERMCKKRNDEFQDAFLKKVVMLI